MQTMKSSTTDLNKGRLHKRQGDKLLAEGSNKVQYKILIDHYQQAVDAYKDVVKSDAASAEHKNSAIEGIINIQRSVRRKYGYTKEVIAWLTWQESLFTASFTDIINSKLWVEIASRQHDYVIFLRKGSRRSEEHPYAISIGKDPERARDLMLKLKKAMPKELPVNWVNGMLIYQTAECHQACFDLSNTILTLQEFIDFVEEKKLYSWDDIKFISLIETAKDILAIASETNNNFINFKAIEKTGSYKTATQIFKQAVSNFNEKIASDNISTEEKHKIKKAIFFILEAIKGKFGYTGLVLGGLKKLAIEHHYISAQFALVMFVIDHLLSNQKHNEQTIDVKEEYELILKLLEKITSQVSLEADDKICQCKASYYQTSILRSRKSSDHKKICKYYKSFLESLEDSAFARVRTLDDFKNAIEEARSYIIKNDPEGQDWLRNHGWLNKNKKHHPIPDYSRARTNNTNCPATTSPNARQASISQNHTGFFSYLDANVFSAFRARLQSSHLSTAHIRGFGRSGNTVTLTMSDKDSTDLFLKIFDEASQTAKLKSYEQTWTRKFNIKIEGTQLFITTNIPREAEKIFNILTEIALQKNELEGSTLNLTI